MDKDALAERFESQGFVVLEDFFSLAELRTCREATALRFPALASDAAEPAGDDVAATAASSDADAPKDDLASTECEVIAWGPVEEKVAAFVALAGDARLAEATRAAMPGGFVPMYSLAMFSPPRSKGQSWHQDCAPTPGKAKHHNVNRLIYLWDVDERTGGEVVLVPGTHRGQVLPPGGLQDDIEGQVVLRPRAGTLVFVHGQTFHRVKPVRRARVSVNLRVRPPEAPEDVTDVAVYRNMKYRFSTKEVLERRG
ncbi:MAG: phytanoyl-CoA dioxygenase family protein [Planctomycetota bacterium]|nr:phytanoyl-CoA dioxygenase family protein [Planctomycetota bacterium]